MKRPWLAPLAPLYAAGSALRWMGVKPRRLGWPVVSVGSLSAGGAGKTPFVIALARLLKAQGVHVDVLSRGYGRSSDGAARVDPAGTAEESGDEPLLIAREAGVPVYVGARRWEAGQLAETGEADPSLSTPATKTDRWGPRSAQDDKSVERVHLLDDGFQHRQLARDVDVVLVSSEDLEDWLLPAGNRREPLSALRRGTVFALAEGDNRAAQRLRRMGLGPEFGQPVWWYRREMIAPEVTGPVLAFCGIARPGQFFAGLERAGVELVGRTVFPDHHRFIEKDLAGLRELAARTGAKALVTTAKDRVRLGSRTAGMGLPVVAAGLRVEFADEDAVAKGLQRVSPLRG